MDSIHTMHVSSTPEVNDESLQKPTDSYIPDKGASISFTFKEGLIVQILPNGSVQ